jgi:ribosomal protein S18 acetylase RimI-like enzyme
VLQQNLVSVKLQIDAAERLSNNVQSRRGRTLQYCRDRSAAAPAGDGSANLIHASEGQHMDYVFKHGIENMDFPCITRMLSATYWSPGIKTAEVVQGSRHSALVVGAFDQNDNQIGFARVISDKTRFAYIVDVIVDESQRRKGIGPAMVRYILAHRDLEAVYQWLLVTKDAHEVYKKVGFKVTARAGDYMEIRNPRPNRQ